MSEANFRKGLRSAVRGLYSGAISEAQFRDAMQSAISRNLSVAWQEGATDCGIAADELSDEEIKARDEFIENQYTYLAGFGEAIAENGDNRLRDLYSRVELWVNRYGEIRDKAKAMACADSKLEWKINARCKEHCSSCVRLNGKVKRGSYWNKTILPRSQALECGGWRCCCSLMVTDKPVTRGRLSF